ncbi:MAG: hypothetical protein BWY61_00598 [Firmicutes bacterium ADurb.Bin354]|nr:MAG: hypothetical protein BWY61_00598 [Firmicutes bacterium ADurb.Bin354]
MTAIRNGCILSRKDNPFVYMIEDIKLKSVINTGSTLTDIVPILINPSGCERSSKIQNDAFFKTGSVERNLYAAIRKGICNRSEMVPLRGLSEEYFCSL